MLRLDVVRPISELLEARAHDTPDALAVRDESRAAGYGELDERTRRLAARLRADGVSPGDRVALYMTNTAAWLEASLATVRAGAVCVPVPAAATAKDAAFMLADSGARTVFVDEEHRQLLADGRASVPALADVAAIIAGEGEPGVGERSLDEMASDPAGAAADDCADLDGPAWIIYTSGTTGRPKGVVLTQRSMLWVVAAGWLPFLEWEAHDHVLCPLPLTHSYPLDAALASIAAGSCYEVQAKFSPTATLEILNGSDVTVLLGVPTVFSYLLHETETTAYSRGKLRMCVSAGAVLPEDVAARAERALGVPILDAYGATEASTAITMASPKGSRPRGSCGVSLPGMAVRVVDPVSLADRAPGEEGEVIARGPGIMLGYHNRERETADTLRDGWYHTGDLGQLDVHGHLTITGRLKDIIIRGGENIAPAEIESVAIEHPLVDDCAVVAVRHEDLGEVPVLAVVCTSADDLDTAVEDVTEYCADRLPAFKRPDRIVPVEAVPRTGSGKVMRHRLHDLIEVKAS